jgi:hypothetical protein
MKKYASFFCAVVFCSASFAQYKLPTNESGAKENFSAYGESGNQAKQGFSLAPEFKNLVRPGMKIQVEETLGLPNFLWATQHPEVSQSLVLSIEGKAREYLNIYAGVYGYSADTLATARLRYIHDIGRGPIIAKFEQYIGGIQVYGNEMNVNMDRNTDLISLSGHLYPHDVSLARPTFNIDMKGAIVVAFGDMEDEVISPLDLVKVEERGVYQYFNFNDGARIDGAVRMGDPARIKQVWYALPDSFLPAYYIELNTTYPGNSDSELYAYIISALDGRLLERVSLKDSETYTYRVWADGGPGNWVPWDGPLGEASPHPTGMPDGHQEPFREPVLLTLQNVPFQFNDPWLPDASTETVGNNADAYIDHGSDGYQPGTDFRADITSTNTFDHTFDGNSDPATTESGKAAVTQLFYINNYLHDVYYDFGFDEAAGNAQTDNFGRGGAGNDSIRAEGQDGSGTDNANMNTPGDGGRPRMQMYIFTGPNPRRDGTIDNGISGHEWGHYFHRRLAASFSNRQSGSMGEGNGDIIATLLAVREGDNYDGAYATGPYATYQFFFAPTYDENFFFGIRRYCYSTDFNLNALTFKHIGGAINTLPTGTPISPIGWEGNGNSEVHNAGEIWCMSFWEVYRALIADYQNRGSNFGDAKAAAQTYLVAGLKLWPSNATFTEARDGILAAAAATNIDDFITMAKGYARRGMGRDAVSPDRFSTTLTGVVESFDPILYRGFSLTSATVDDSIANCDADGVLDGGETGLLTVTLDNISYDTVTMLSATTATITSPDNVSFSNGGVINFPSSFSGDSIFGTIEVTLDDNNLSLHEITLNIEWDDTAQYVDPANEDVPVTVNMDGGGDETEFCGCFATLPDAVAAILDSLGNGEWPGSRDVADYVTTLNNICAE